MRSSAQCHVRIRYFASIKDCIGMQEEYLVCNAGTTVRALRDMLVELKDWLFSPAHSKAGRTA
jgi:molybdopterin converting factor small subunit